jgi:hypothetical protein
MREEFGLGTALATGIAQDSLGAKLVQAKCADLTAAVDAQQAIITGSPGSTSRPTGLLGLAIMVLF